MKAIITFFTQTGNTEMLADAAHKELSRDCETVIKPVEQISVDELSGFDLVIVSSPIHGGGLANPVQALLANLPSAPGFKLAALITHLSEIYQTREFERGLDMLVKTCDAKQIEYLGYYDSQGKLAPAIQPMVQSARGMNDDDFKRYMAELDKHPTAEEVAGAAAFVREIVSKI